LAESEAESVRPSVDVYWVGPENADDDVAERLGLSPGAKVLVRRRRYLSDDQPTESATSFIPWALAEGTAMTGRANWN
jgi:GntR family transcriptional regulator